MIAITADLEKIRAMLAILGLIILSLVVLTFVVYWLFLDSKIKNKKTILSSFKPKYKIIIYTVLYCAGINFLLSFITLFVIEIESLEVTYVLMQQIQFTAYIAFLLVPRMFIFCLQISVRKEESDEKIKFLEALKLFWSISKDVSIC